MVYCTCIIPSVGYMAILQDTGWYAPGYGINSQKWSPLFFQFVYQKPSLASHFWMLLRDGGGWVFAGFKEKPSISEKNVKLYHHLHWKFKKRTKQFHLIIWCNLILMFYGLWFKTSDYYVSLSFLMCKMKIMCVIIWTNIHNLVATHT